MDIPYYKSLLSSLLNNFFASDKANWLIKGFFFVFAYFSGIHVYFYAIVALSLIDCFTGVWSSVKQGISFKSSILRKGLIQKFLLYNLLMLSVFVIESVLKAGFDYSKYYMVMIATMLICTNELVSIFENVLKINPNLTFVTSLIKLTNQVQETTVNTAEKKIEDLSKGI